MYADILRWDIIVIFVTTQTSFRRVVLTYIGVCLLVYHTKNEINEVH